MRRFDPGSRLRPHQRQHVSRVLERLSGFGFDRVALHGNLEELLATLAPACRDDDDCWAMADELAEWVRWHRAPAFCLTYLFQALTQRMDSPAHVAAAVLFADAQIGLADDMALLSTEVAWHSLEGELAAAPDLADALAPFRQAVVARLRDMHTYYGWWCRPFAYADANPLVDTLYTRRLWWDLTEEFPDHAEGISTGHPPAEKAAAFARIADEARAREDTYHWLVARRLAALHRSGAGDLPAAEAELAACLRDAREFGLEAEIGHLLRSHAWHLMRLGDLATAEYELEEAMAHEQPITVLGYWYGLSARELGDVRARIANVVSDPETALDASLDAYYQGRRVLDLMLESGGPEAGAVSKRQLLRSFTDNAIIAAAARGRADDILAEVESSGPRTLAGALAESRAVGQLDDADVPGFLAARTVFRHRLTAVPRSFADYLAALPVEYDARRDYEVLRGRMRLLPGRRASDEIVRRLSAHVPDDRLVLAFFLGAHTTSRAVLFDLATGGVTDRVVGEVEQPLRAAHRAYAAALAAAAEVPEYPPVRARRALAEFLTAVETLLAPALELLAEWAPGRHVVVVPQLHLNAVPVAALRAGGDHLVDVAASVSTVPSLGVLADLLDDDTAVAGTGLTVLHETKGTPFFAGTLRRLAARRAVSVLADPARQAALSELAENRGGDLFLACHGRFDNDDPGASTLTVAPGVDLSLADIWAGVAGSASRCVVLGACESGLARAEIGSEYAGIAGALLSSGVRSVVGSLWKVNQLATALLLDDCLGRAGQPVPTALAAAQRTLRALSRDEVGQWLTASLPELEPLHERMVSTLPATPFTHPDDWAGFFVAGIG